MTLLVLGTALLVLATALERPDAGYLVGSLDEGALRTVLSSAPLEWTGEDPWLVAWKAPPPRAHRARIPNAANVRYCTRVIFIIVVRWSRLVLTGLERSPLTVIRVFHSFFGAVTLTF